MRFVLKSKLSKTSPIWAVGLLCFCQSLLNFINLFFFFQNESKFAFSFIWLTQTWTNLFKLLTDVWNQKALERCGHYWLYVTIRKSQVKQCLFFLLRIVCYNKGCAHLIIFIFIVGRFIKSSLDHVFCSSVNCDADSVFLLYWWALKAACLVFLENKWALHRDWSTLSA